jgi:hypothetical protein
VATLGEDGAAVRAKLDAVCFRWFYPFFFVVTGIKFDVTALGRDLTTTVLMPAFLLLRHDCRPLKGDSTSAALANVGGRLFASCRFDCWPRDYSQGSLTHRSYFETRRFPDHLILGEAE